ncbi:uncharacterized protein LOC135594384 [Musa acuminata AAA Group]|uniref:uncharacterized protein LOC135594384 n=1 Tax=Musa acuminata AAA Group TaxID=214697 RepID=UPI0031D86E42
MVRARESYVYMASNVIKTAAQARGWGIRKCPCDSESRWGMEPADKITGISVGAASCVNSIKITFEIDGTTGVTPRYGGSDGELFQITLMQDEYLTSVSGYVRHIFRTFLAYLNSCLAPILEGHMVHMEVGVEPFSK